MTHCINKYIHKYAKHLLWMMRKKNLVALKEKKKNCDGSPRNQPKYSLKRQRWPAETHTWLTVLMKCRDGNGFLFKTMPHKKSLSVARNLEAFVSTWCELKGEFPLRRLKIGEPCTKNYLITVHMFIYSTTTSICAFWTVTKWCFIACCIDDANYNCSSTILE